MSEPHEYGLKQPGHVTYCTHCGAEKPAYTGSRGPFGVIDSISRWVKKHAAECPNSPRRQVKA